MWHQSLLVFAQRYKFELDESQKSRLKELVRIRLHHQITPEVRRELFGRDPVQGLHAAASEEMETA